MKFYSGPTLVLAALSLASAAEMTPLAKVMQLLTDLGAKIESEGAEAKRAYTEFSEWCVDESKRLEFEIKTGKAGVEELTSSIGAATARASSLATKIDELAASAATDDKDLKAATKQRAAEAADFAAAEKELVETIDTIKRAVGVLEREMSKGTASMLQGQGLSGVVGALRAMVQASSITSSDASRLTALVQAQAPAEGAGEAEEEQLGAPAAAVYESKSGGIVETLEGLLEKAQEQLAQSRQTETTAVHNFLLVKQSLEDSIRFGSKDLAEAKKGLSAASQKKANDEGALAVTSKDLQADGEALADLEQDCMARAKDFEAAEKSRGEEIKALAEAKKVISEATGGAETLTYAPSLLQRARADAADGDAAATPARAALRLVRELARRQGEPALSQLASRMASAMSMGASGAADPFAKVRGLIEGLIEKLEDAASADATQKAYCDKELAESKAKKADHDSDISKLTAKIDQATARSAQLKQEVAMHQKELSDLAASQAEMDRMRQAEKASFAKNRPEMEQGIEGVKLALKVLREYYAQGDKAHDAASGSAGGIVGLLEVVESDFTKGLAEMVTMEESAAAAYKKETQENEVLRAAKEQDAKYKAKEAGDLGGAAAELSSDRSGLTEELAAVTEYLEKLEEKCVAKPETYEVRARHRDAEIAGLKEALRALDGESALLQRRSISKHARTALRGLASRT